MKVALDVLLILLVLVAGLWIALFGSTGAVMATRARFTRLQGFFAGVLLGPAGLVWLLIRSRSGSSRNVERMAPSTSPSPRDPSEVSQPSSGDVDFGI
jgi:hypothetical protein